MDDYRGENRIVLRGQAAGEPALSHRNHGVDYYVAPLRVPRLSGVDDVLNIVTADPGDLSQPSRYDPTTQKTVPVTTPTPPAACVLSF